MKATFDDLPAGTWTENQANEAMRRVAVEAAEGWGGLLFLTIEEAFAPGALPELKQWALDVASATTLNLIAQTEQIAASLGLSPDQTRHLIEDRVGACRTRLVELAGRFSSRGCA